MKIVKLIFSYDRPLQLWGLVKSILDNTDVKAKQITCICKSSTEGYRRSYDTVASELDCRVFHEPAAPEGFWRRFNHSSLYDLVLALSEGAEFVSLAVDDMCYFRHADFAYATGLVRDDADICLWSWRIGADLQPHASLDVRDSHWRADRTVDVMPYRYVFHTDGSLYRRADLAYWFSLLPRLRRRAMNLNEIEGWLSQYSEPKRARGPKLGRFHAGPLEQTCITWQVNKVVTGGSGHWSGAQETEPPRLLELFESGTRLDYSPLYGRTDWIAELNASCPNPPTHVAATPEAVKMWMGLCG